MLVDIDKTVPGTVGDTDGVVTRAAVADGHSYDILDEIAGRAISTGAKLLAVRKEDVPEGHLWQLFSAIRYERLHDRVSSRLNGFIALRPAAAS